MRWYAFDFRQKINVFIHICSLPQQARFALMSAFGSLPKAERLSDTFHTAEPFLQVQIGFSSKLAKCAHIWAHLESPSCEYIRSPHNQMRALASAGWVSTGGRERNRDLCKKRATDASPVYIFRRCLFQLQKRGFAVKGSELLAREEWRRVIGGSEGSSHEIQSISLSGGSEAVYVKQRDLFFCIFFIVVSFNRWRKLTLLKASLRTGTKWPISCLCSFLVTPQASAGSVEHPRGQSVHLPTVQTA